MLRVECPASPWFLGPQTSFWLRGQFRAWLPEAHRTPPVQVQGPLSSALSPDQPPGQMASSVALPNPLSTPCGGFRAGETLKDFLVQSLPLGIGQGSWTS